MWSTGSNNQHEQSDQHVQSDQHNKFYHTD